MHPVFRQGLAAEHIKAMLAADEIRPVRRASRARRRTDAGRTGLRATGVAGCLCPQPGGELAEAGGFSVNRTETAGSVPDPGRSGLP